MGVKSTQRKVLILLGALLFSGGSYAKTSHSHPQAQMFSLDLPDFAFDMPLTPLGETVRTIVVVDVERKGLDCGESLDWHSTLPKVLGHYTGSRVLAYDHHAGQDEPSCTTCWAPEDMPTDCRKDITGIVDLLIIIGTGQNTAQDVCNGDPPCPELFPTIAGIMRLPWAKNARTKVHFPVRSVGYITSNKLFGFDHLIPIDGFPKPTREDDTSSTCSAHGREDMFIYIGRASPDQGQAAFLHAANPEAFGGFRIAFYGMDADVTHGTLQQEKQDYIKGVLKLAKSRGFSVEIHGRVSSEELFRAMCRAKGMVLMSDQNNPLVVYKAAKAGLPLLVSREARIYRGMANSSFVVTTSLHNDKATIKAAIANFMKLVRNGETHYLREVIKRWAASELRMDTVYLGICKEIGICA